MELLASLTLNNVTVLNNVTSGITGTKISHCALSKLIPPKVVQFTQSPAFADMYIKTKVFNHHQDMNEDE